MQIHQVIVSASMGDAITDAAIELRNLLRSIGESDIYALHIDARVKDEVIPLKYFSQRANRNQHEDVIVFHASIGESVVTDLVRDAPERLIMIYHNISPWERFVLYDPKKAGLLAAGRIELESLRERAMLALTVSEYNACELRDLGFRNVEVAPLVVDIARLKSVPSHGPTANHLETQLSGPLILYVGQMLPHKRPELLIQAYHILVTHLMPSAHLALVGTHRLPLYSETLEFEINELNLSRAWMTGSVSIEQLVAYYRNAALFVTMSEHEGFCVPILEAMGFGVPVVARATAAIPETAQDGALLLPQDATPALIAETMHEMLINSDLRAKYIEQGTQRVGDFNPDTARAMLVNKILKATES